MHAVRAGEVPRDRRLADLAARSHRVVTLTQLTELGFTKPAVQRKLERGQLRRRYRGVYAVGPGRLDRRGEWLAAVRAAGEGSLLYVPSAGALHDVERERPGPVHVIRIGRSRREPGLVVHTTREIHGDDRDEIAGIPVVSLPRALLAIAASGERRRLERALVAAEKAGTLDRNAVLALLARSRGRAGAALLREELGHYRDDGSRSELERLLPPLLAAAGLPAAELNVRVEGQLVDAYWPAQRVVAELDSWEHHRDRRAFERDRARTNALTAAGYTSLRFTWAMLRCEPGRVGTQLAAVLG